MLTRYAGILLLCLITSSLLAQRADGAKYRVIIYNDGEETAQALGTWIAEDVLLTSSDILDWGDQFFVEDPGTGTRYLATLRSSSSSIALLSVRGLSISDVTPLSAEPPQLNSDVHFSLLDGTQQNGLLSFESTTDSLFTHRYRFTMAVDSSTIGAPLVNRCDQVVSVVSAHTDADGVLVGVSESYEALVSFLRADSVSFTIAPAPCPTIEDQLSEAQVRSATLQANLDSLRNELKSLEDSSAASLDQSAEQIASLTAHKSILERRIADTEAMVVKHDSVLNESERLKIALDSLKERNDEAQGQLTAREAQNREQLLLLGGIAAALILLAAILLFLFWRRRRDAEEELLDKDDELQKAEEIIQKRSASFPDIVLHGFGPRRRKFVLRLVETYWPRANEVSSFGRSSKADCVVVGRQRVRQHACMSLLGHTVMIQDLESLNGTVVDGMKLAPRQKHAVSQGSQIKLGDVTLTMIIH